MNASKDGGIGMSDIEKLIREMTVEEKAARG